MVDLQFKELKARLLNFEQDVVGELYKLIEDNMKKYEEALRARQKAEDLYTIMEERMKGLERINHDYEQLKSDIDDKLLELSNQEQLNINRIASVESKVMEFRQKEALLNSKEAEVLAAKRDVDEDVKTVKEQFEIIKKQKEVLNHKQKDLEDHEKRLNVRAAELNRLFNKLSKDD